MQLSGRFLILNNFLTKAIQLEEESGNQIHWALESLNPLALRLGDQKAGKPL
jgi:hypothetical protein